MSFSTIPLAGSTPEQYAQLLEQARALLHRGERVRLVGPVDPGADQAVRVVDAQPVIGAKHPLDPPDEEAERRAGVAGRVQVLARVEQRVVPRLPLRVGAAGRCAEQVVRQ